MSSIQNDRQDQIENQINQLNQFRSSGWETAFKAGIVIGALALFASGTMLAAHFCPHLVAYSQITYYASVVGLPTSFVLLSVSTAGAILAHRRNEKKWQQAIEDLRTLQKEVEENNDASGSEGSGKAEKDPEIQKLERKNTRLKEKLEELNQTAGKDHDELLAEKLELTREKENKDKTIEDLTDQLRRVQRDLDKVNGENRQFGDEVADLRIQLEAAESDQLLKATTKAFVESETPEEANEKIEKLKKKATDRNNKREERKAQLESAQQGIDRLKKQLEEVEQGRQQIISQLEQNLARSEKKRTELEEELQKLKSESAASSKSEKKSKPSEDADKKKIEKLEFDLASKDASLIIAESDLKAAQETIAELQKKLKTEEKPIKSEESLGLSDYGLPRSYIEGLQKNREDRKAKKGSEKVETPRSAVLDQILEEYDESESAPIKPLNINDLEKKQPDRKTTTVSDEIRPPSQGSTANPRPLPVTPSSVASRKAAFEPKNIEKKPPAVIYGDKKDNVVEDKEYTADGGTPLSIKRLIEAKGQIDDDSDQSSFLKKIFAAGKQDQEQDLNDSITEDNLLDSVAEYVVAEKEKKAQTVNENPPVRGSVSAEAIANAVDALNLSPRKKEPIDNNDLSGSWTVNPKSP